MHSRTSEKHSRSKDRPSLVASYIPPLYYSVSSSVYIILTIHGEIAACKDEQKEDKGGCKNNLAAFPPGVYDGKKYKEKKKRKEKETT